MTTEPKHGLHNETFYLLADGHASHFAGPTAHNALMEMNIVVVQTAAVHQPLGPAGGPRPAFNEIRDMDECGVIRAGFSHTGWVPWDPQRVLASPAARTRRASSTARTLISNETLRATISDALRAMSLAGTDIRERIREPRATEFATFSNDHAHDHIAKAKRIRMLVLTKLKKADLQAVLQLAGLRDAEQDGQKTVAALKEMFLGADANLLLPLVDARLAAAQAPPDQVE